jgi:chitinase
MCYDSGQWTRRGRMINAADQFCDQNLKGKTITENWNPGVIKKSFDREPSEVVSVEILAFVEALPGCKWKVDVNRCKAVFRDIIDDCDTNGENRKQGGRWENNCLKWRLDPNADL